MNEADGVDRPNVFISYSHLDELKVNGVADRLKHDGVKVWIDKPSIRLGDSVPELIDAALSRVSIALLFFSANYTNSPWCKTEWHAIFTKHVTDGAPRIIILHLDDSEVPQILRHLRRLDIREDWELHYDQILEACRRELVTCETKVAETFQLAPCSRPPLYIEALLNEVRDLPAVGLGVSIDNIYVAPTAANTDQKPATATGDEFETTDNLLSALNDHSLLLLGGPGDGKSTFCRRVVTLLTEDCSSREELREEAQLLHENHRRRLPLFLQLGDFWQFVKSQAITPQHSISDALKLLCESKWRSSGLTWSIMNAHLDAGSAFLILDGIDDFPCINEVDSPALPAPREWLLQSLHSSIKKWITAGNRILVTARATSLTPDETGMLAPYKSRNPLLKPIYLESLTPKKQEELATKLFQILGRSPDDAAAMLDAVRRHQTITTFAFTPMFLTALCLTWHECDGRFEPRYHAADLLERLVHSMLSNRFQEHIVDQVRFDLARIAAKMHSNGSSEPIDQLPAKRVNGEIEVLHGGGQHAQRRQFHIYQSGLLQMCRSRKDHVQFAHSSYQDFLAGEALAEGSLTNLFVAHADTERWHAALSFAYSAALAQSDRKAVCLDTIAALVFQLDVGTAAQLIVLGDWIRQFSECMGCAKGPTLSSPARIEREQFLGIRNRFQHHCQQLFRAEIPFADRLQGAMALGLVGDPRIQSDIRHVDAYVAIPSGVYQSCGRTIEINDPFLLAKVPVTNCQYADFVSDGGYLKNEFWSECGRDWLRRREQTKDRPFSPLYWHHNERNAANQPVVGVSFWEVDAFCKWAGVRLMTSDEWEAAAAGSDGSIYPWGNELPGEVRFDASQPPRHAFPVGLLPRTKSGLEDMAANVWQWCQDNIHGDRRVVRGGYFSGNPKWYECSYQGNAEQDRRFGSIGFRVVRNVDGG